MSSFEGFHKQTCFKDGDERRTHENTKRMGTSYAERTLSLVNNFGII